MMALDGCCQNFIWVMAISVRKMKGHEHMPMTRDEEEIQQRKSYLMGELYQFFDFTERERFSDP